MIVNLIFKKRFFYKKVTRILTEANSDMVNYVGSGANGCSLRVIYINKENVSIYIALGDESYLNRINPNNYLVVNSRQCIASV